jgi:hypothetical protein
MAEMDRPARAVIAVVIGGLSASCSVSTSGSAARDAVAPDTGGAPAQISVDAGHVLSGSVRMAVPAYFPPGHDWQRVIAAAPLVGMIVFDPNNGPGGTGDGGSTVPDYSGVLAQARAAGITVLGYVATSYGQRAAADVLADVDAYYRAYQLSGIYFAEGPMEADCAGMEAEYHSFADAARQHDPKAFLAVGTKFCPTYIYFFDVMVEFARNWTEYQSYQPPSWMPANSPQRFCHFVNAVPPSDAGAAISMAIGNGAGWIYVTDQADPNPWGTLPSYFDQEVQALMGLQ